jgi:hypothetical protein
MNLSSSTTANAQKIWKYVLRDVVWKLLSSLSPDKVLTFIRKHFFYLFWILLAPIVLYFMAQGRELFTGLFDDSNFVSGIRAVFLMAAFFAQSMSILLLPRPFFKRLVFQQWEKIRYKDALNNPGLTYMLSVLPIILYGMVMIAVQTDEIRGWQYLLIVPTLLLAFFFAAWAEGNWKCSIRRTLLMLLGNVALAGTVVSLDKVRGGAVLELFHGGHLLDVPNGADRWPEQKGGPSLPGSDQPRPA